LLLARQIHHNANHFLSTGAARIDFIESKLLEASSELEHVDPFESADYDSDSNVRSFSERSATMHDNIEGLLMDCGHSGDEELLGEATEAAKLNAEARVLAMQVSQTSVHRKKMKSDFLPQFCADESPPPAPRPHRPPLRKPSASWITPVGLTSSRPTQLG
jgi:hypothetical protein